MNRLIRFLSVLIYLSATAVFHSACASNDGPQPQSLVRIDADGTVHVPAIDVPLSTYMSAQAKARFVEDARNQPLAGAENKSIGEFRKEVDGYYRPFVERAQAIYPVSVQESKIAGIATQVVTPRQGIPSRNRARVLINLHAGSFVVGAGLGGLAESIPIAAGGRIKVISIDYREGPEYQFPAASEDVAAVYRQLLKGYHPQNIGIYGCSAGGILTAMSVAWIQRQKLPVPGAIGIFGSGAFGSFYGAPAAAGTWGGDSRFVTPPLVGEQPLKADPTAAAPVPADMATYLAKANLADPLVSPALAPAVLAQFPPTLLITGTRAYDMSAAVQTQRVLTNAGVKADLHLWDGMGHCFFVDSDLPESREAFAVMVKFFHEHLGHPLAARSRTL